MNEPASGKRLTVHNASVTTMTVEVKTLTIGARQVTQGIFKQLIEEPLIAEDGTLNGVPWGHVTWHPEGCTRDDHWHIVWQRGENLRRAHVAKDATFGTLICAEADALLAHHVSRMAHGLPTSTRLNRCNDLVTTRSETLSIDESVNDETGVHVQANWQIAARKVACLGFDIPHAEAEATKPLTQHRAAPHRGVRPSELERLILMAISDGVLISLAPDFSDFQIITTDEIMEAELRAAGEPLLELLKQRMYVESVVEARSQLVDWLSKLDEEIGASDAGWEAAKAAYDAAVRAEAGRRERHREVRSALAQLPQLFIGG
jgi:hypothetical protein